MAKGYQRGNQKPTPLVSFDHCVVCPSLTYGFWLPLWYLLAIVLSVLLWLTASDYPFDIFWPLCMFYSSRSFPHSRLITGFVTRLTQRVPLVEHELLILLEQISSSPVFSGVRVTRSLTYSGYKKTLKIPKWYSESVNEKKKTENTMIKRKRIKGQTTI
jgi:hypothetical protein